jgi:hypothetical protein
MTEPDLTPLGRLLEKARKEVLQITGREAARRAGISEGRWRQVVTGRQPSGDRLVPVNPRGITVVQMALAVGVDPAEALAAASLPSSPESVAAVVEQARDSIARKQGKGGEPPVPTQADLDALREIRDDPDRPQAFRRQAQALLDQIGAMLQAAEEEERARREAR